MNTLEQSLIRKYPYTIMQLQYTKAMKAAIRSEAISLIAFPDIVKTFEIAAYVSMTKPLESQKCIIDLTIINELLECKLLG